jgi:hypothetical protein
MPEAMRWAALVLGVVIVWLTLASLVGTFAVPR